MPYLKQAGAFVVSRPFLALLAVVLAACIIWFTGDLLALSGVRPMASREVRLALIVLLLLLGILWLASGPYSLVGVGALCLLIWHAGPTLAIGEARPLTPIGTRIALLVAVLSLYALYGCFRLWQALRSNDDLLARFLFRKALPQEHEAAKEELRRVAAGIQAAVAALRKMRGFGRLHRMLDGKRHLYELPWYMVLGSPGVGKTTVLRHSGLQFPLARQWGLESRTMLSDAPAETSHCDWWIANEAVFIDTAGRYTTQRDHAARDPAEWRGFLGLLRSHRVRAPINGVIVVLSVAELLAQGDAERSEHAALLRDRLAELRQVLGIRFPVYVIVAQIDRLRGFREYFHSLTSDSRAQPWGFTLPLALKGRLGSRGSPAPEGEGLHSRVRAEFELLQQRIEAGLHARLNEEFDVERRRRLFALPRELAGLSSRLLPLLEQVFLSSRFDDTQNREALRGVYFTSGAQAGAELPADGATLLQRMRRRLAETRDVPSACASQEHADPEAARGQQGFFIQGVLARVIIPEAHLVRPNLRWEFRFRLMRILGHALVIVLFVWLAGALALSFGNNQRYLEAASQRTNALSLQVRSLFDGLRTTDVPDALNAARELPSQPGLDLDDPGGAYLYGLYAAPGVLAAAGETYARLQNRTLLPAIVRRMEVVLSQRVKEGDAKAAYDALRAYKLLFDRSRYMKGGAAEVRDWVLGDWELSGGATAFGGRAAVVEHAVALFSGERALEVDALPDAALVRAAQDFLGTQASTQRIYERAKAAMEAEAPQAFTLIRAVGPQAGAVFSRDGGLPLDQGVPGLFTYDGYHEVFDKRLPEFAARAFDDDGWVMGRGAASSIEGSARDAQGDPRLADIRRRYLEEYAKHWEHFLASVRPVGGSDAAATNLGFDLGVLRQLAALDSPLSRLARAAARETTLSRPLMVPAQETRGLLDKAAEQMSRQTEAMGRRLGIRAEERMERQIVDDRFAALRELVTGQPDVGALPGGTAGTAKPGLEAVTGLINEFYTLLVVADTALSAQSLPPGGAEVGARLLLEAGKLPAPFREVLTALATSGGSKVVQGATAILRGQAQLQFDRLMGLMAQQVGEPCRRGVEGRYPLAATVQDASIEDFTLMFAVGGAADEFFAKHLAALVDTSVRPWRYKDPGNFASLEVPAGPAAPVAATGTTGPTLAGELLKLLALGGPNLEAFDRARQIRDLFFREADGRKLGWKLELKVLELEPSITDLGIDIDGQGQRYVHGPVQALSIHWPGPRGGSMAELSANPRVSGPTSTVGASGPWALLRLLDKGRLVSTATPGRTSVEFQFDGRRALLDIGSGSQPHPFNSDLLKGFRCPGRMG